MTNVIFNTKTKYIKTRKKYETGNKSWKFGLIKFNQAFEKYKLAIEILERVKRLKK